jgi:catechol 2,3-dioxygenase-like lactoylglutathione lyase family enzyme
MPQDRFDHLFIAPSDFDGAVAFYRDVLGWRSVSSWGGDDEPRGTILDGGAVSVVLAERHATDDHSWSHGINGQRPTVHLTVTDLDERFVKLGSRADVVVVSPETTHWGTRWFVVKDPDGNLIAYEQLIAKKPEDNDGR